MHAPVGLAVAHEGAQVAEPHPIPSAQFGGRHIRVDRAAERSKGIHGGGTHVLYEPSRSVFVGNLPFDIQVPKQAQRVRNRSASLAARHSLARQRPAT